MQIMRAQIRRPEELPKVSPAGNQGVGASGAHRQPGHVAHHVSVLLHHERDDAHHRRQQKEQRLLHHQPPPTLLFPTLQRPVIQQQEHTGQRHHHRLAHQPQGEKYQSRSIKALCPRAPGLGLLGESRICPQRQQPEHRAQHILALGNPGHRFHPQRVQTK